MMDLIYLLEDDDSIRKLVIYALNSQGYEAKGFELPGGVLEGHGHRPSPTWSCWTSCCPEEDGLTILQKLRAGGADEEAARHHAHGQEHGV